jgi:hypothetical protein
MCLHVSRVKGERCLTFENLDPFRHFVEKNGWNSAADSSRRSYFHIFPFGLFMWPKFRPAGNRNTKVTKWRECIHAADTPMIRTKSFLKLNVCAEYTVKNTMFGLLLAVCNAHLLTGEVLQYSPDTKKNYPTDRLLRKSCAQFSFVLVEWRTFKKSYV